jgi:hypothetical protein
MSAASAWSLVALKNAAELALAAFSDATDVAIVVTGADGTVETYHAGKGKKDAARIVLALSVAANKIVEEWSAADSGGD